MANVVFLIEPPDGMGHEFSYIQDDPFSPEEVFKRVNNDQEFRQWVESIKTEYLSEALKRFEEDEYYEQCAIILSVMEQEGVKR